MKKSVDIVKEDIQIVQDGENKIEALDAKIDKDAQRKSANNTADNRKKNKFTKTVEKYHKLNPKLMRLREFNR